VIGVQAGGGRTQQGRGYKSDYFVGADHTIIVNVPTWA
jgi:hypothetical protein